MKKFMGIAPRYDTFLQEGYAVIAENCDLSSGKLKPLRDNSLVDELPISSDFVFYTEWITGAKDYIDWPINEFDILFYLEGTKLKKKIWPDVANVGQVVPTKPVIADAGAGNITDTVQYIVTWSRSVGGYVDESGPSFPSDELQASGRQIQITRPTGYDSFVTHWNIYRIGYQTGEFQFVEAVVIADTTYTDNNFNADLSASPTTWFTSDQGNEIAFAPPPALSGVTGPHAGMLFGWRESTLYWSEPGYADAWPVFYSVNFPSNIIAAMPFAGALAVLTQNGAFRIDGNHPELLQQTEALGAEPCLSSSVCRSSKGIFFLSDSGLTLFNNFESVVVSDQAFTEIWFRENITSASSVLAENDNVIYIFHSTGTLYFDMKTAQRATMPGIFNAVWKDHGTGWLYAGNSSGIYKIESLNNTVMLWKSGDIVASIKDIPWKEIEVIGTGEIILTVYIDDADIAAKVLIFNDLYRLRTLGLPQEYQGRRLQLQFQGTGTIEEVIPSV